jgi:translation elongation factor EF-Tu-like GTPase
VTAGLKKALANTRFRDAPIVPVTAAAGARPEGADTTTVTNLTVALVQALRRPRRSDDGPFLMAVDHWYGALATESESERESVCVCV